MPPPFSTHPHLTSARADERAALLGHRAAILWLTGLPGSGKTTLANGLERLLLANGILVTVIDGDVLRAGLSQDLGFKPADRRENVRRATEVARQMAQAGLVVIVALVSPFRDDRRAAAERLAGIPFAEVYVNAPAAECERRDPKRLYQRARNRELTSFTGIDSPYEPPLAPTLEIRTHLESVECSLAPLYSLALQLAAPATPGAGPGNPLPAAHRAP